MERRINTFKGYSCRCELNVSRFNTETFLSTELRVCWTSSGTVWKNLRFFFFLIKPSKIHWHGFQKNIILVTASFKNFFLKKRPLVFTAPIHPSLRVLPLVFFHFDLGEHEKFYPSFCVWGCLWELQKRALRSEWNILGELEITVACRDRPSTGYWQARTVVTGSISNLFTWSKQPPLLLGW